MTPKEKAKELIDKYDFDHNDFDYSKEYALIAVDEIIDIVHNSQVPYWIEVKREINNL